MKQCTKCKELKPYVDFHKHSSSKDGYRWQCKRCHHSYQEGKPDIRAAYSRKSYLKRKQEQPEWFMYQQAKHRAKWDYNNMEFSILPEDIKIPEKCPYLGIPLESLHPRYGYSLDRIDSNKGYTKDNIQVTSRLANIMKSNATEQELISFAKGVLLVHSKEGSGLC